MTLIREALYVVAFWFGATWAAGIVALGLSSFIQELLT
jgi:hypothetical protein